jgi:hypothetical protein
MRHDLELSFPKIAAAVGGATTPRHALGDKD